MQAHASNETVLSVTGLELRRNGRRILGGISWKVRHGQHWAILGANGSGKSSLIRSLAGYFPPSDGELQLLGRRYGTTQWQTLREKIGFVSSSLGLSIPEEGTALETVASGRHAVIDYWGRPPLEERRQAQAILEKVHCGPLAHQPWRHLSQGERQRVLIGRALMARPQLLVLDEPCAGLDPVARERFLHFVDDLARKTEGPHVILVTHHVDEIMPAFTHVLLLKEGMVLGAGPKTRTLSSARLAETYDAPVRLRRRDGRFYLSLEGRSTTPI